MKLRFIAATLAVMAMGTTSIMAEGLQGTPSTPIAIVDSQKTLHLSCQNNISPMLLR